MFHFFGFEFNKVLILFGLQLPRQACEAPARKLQSEEDQDLEEIEAKKVNIEREDLGHFSNYFYLHYKFPYVKNFYLYSQSKSVCLFASKALWICFEIQSKKCRKFKNVCTREGAQ